VIKEMWPCHMYVSTDNRLTGSLSRALYIETNSHTGQERQGGLAS
jgi:hypothetical protein